MEVKIIGAGPAGLYFSLLGKKLNPNYNFSLYERGGRSENIRLGYTITESLREKLFSIGEDITTKIFSQATKPWTIQEHHSKGKIYDGKSTFRLYGIERSVLVNALREAASRKGVRIYYEQRIDEEKAYQFSRECDLLVGADGANSVVRNIYSQNFREHTITGTTAYIWLANRDNLKHMKTVIKDYYGHIFIGVSYPIRGNNNCLIVECKSASLDVLGLSAMVNSDQTISEEGIRFLHDLYTDGGSKFRIRSSNSRWRNSKYVRTDRLFHDNIALIGEAAQTLKFNTGSGLILAFETAEALAQSIREESSSLEQSLSQYASLVHQELNIKWLASEHLRNGAERVLTRYNELDGRSIVAILSGLM